jgi:hypothetical protein
MTLYDPLSFHGYQGHPAPSVTVSEAEEATQPLDPGNIDRLITHGSLIFRVVCENRDRAAYKCLQGSRGAQECAGARERGA